jgi:hypothetical protein
MIGCGGDGRRFCGEGGWVAEVAEFGKRPWNRRLSGNKRHHTPKLRLQIEDSKKMYSLYIV